MQRREKKDYEIYRYVRGKRRAQGKLEIKDKLSFSMQHKTS